MASNMNRKIVDAAKEIYLAALAEFQVLLDGPAPDMVALRVMADDVEAKHSAYRREVHAWRDRMGFYK